jgi:hypothetical protein
MPSVSRVFFCQPVRPSECLLSRVCPRVNVQGLSFVFELFPRTLYDVLAEHALNHTHTNNRPALAPNTPSPSPRLGPTPTHTPAAGVCSDISRPLGAGSEAGKGAARDDPTRDALTERDSLTCAGERLGDADCAGPGPAAETEAGGQRRARPSPSPVPAYGLATALRMVRGAEK